MYHAWVKKIGLIPNTARITTATIMREEISLGYEGSGREPGLKWSQLERG